MYQQWFSKQFIKRAKTVPGYEQYLKHVSKKNYLRGDFVCVAIYDVLDNDGMNELIRKIHRLKASDKYKVHTPFIAHMFKKLNYINSNITGRHTGMIGEISFKDNKWLSDVYISFTYVNNSEAIIEYNFRFKKVMRSFVQIHQFVMDNVKTSRKEDYFHSYADKSIIKTADCMELMRLDDVFFADILQAYICKLFFTRYGKKYKLPIEYCLRTYRYNKKKAKKLRSVFLCECYEKNKEHLIISTLNYDRYEVSHYTTGEYFPNPMLLRFFSNFPTEMYYKAFRDIETAELEKRMRKYLNSKKTFISAKDIKWFVCKIRYIREQDKRMEYTLKEENRDYINQLIGWKCYVHGKLQKVDFMNYPENTIYFRNLYEQNLEYLNSIAMVQNNSVVIYLSVAALVATIIGIIVTIVMG